MCTLAVAFHARADTALAVAANRDELYARPSRPPRIYGDVLMPLDEKEGGTWLGLNARGLFVGITNRAAGPRDPSRRSRGFIVKEALASPSARELHARLSSLPAALHNGFHLLYADGKAAFITWSDGARLLQLELPAGVHAITERSFGAGVDDRAPRVRAQVERLSSSGAPTPAALRELLVQHGPPDAPLEGTCVHADAFGYGTRSSFQLVLPAKGPPSALWTEGPPCTSPAEDISPSIVELFKSH